MRRTSSKALTNSRPYRDRSGPLLLLVFWPYFDILTAGLFARIAQLVEHITDTDGVLGSNPSARTEIITN